MVELFLARKPGDKWRYATLVLRVGGMAREQVAFHQGDADAQEEQQDGERTHNDPPELRVGQEHKEI